jgi:CTP-dependent riboflavin kinase
LKAQKGVEIVPTEEGFCSAKGFLTRLNGTLEAALIIPLVPQYPENKVEIIASMNIREALSIKDGDLVSIEVYLQ